jgi:hypothetical protein
LSHESLISSKGLKNDKKQIICNLIERIINEKYVKYTFGGEIEVNCKIK